MAYQTGTATSADNLLSLLKVWLEGLGWSVNKWEAYSYNYGTFTGVNGAGYRLHVQKTTGDGTVMYFNFRSAVRGYVCSFFNSTYDAVHGKYAGELNGIAMNGSTGYSETRDIAINSIQNAGGGWSVVYYTHFNGKPLLGETVVISGTGAGYYDGTYVLNSDYGAPGVGYFYIHKTWGASSLGTLTVPRRWDFQPGMVLGDTYQGTWAVGMTEISGAIPSYHFFADGETIVVVVEYSTGVYQFLCFGCLEKQGAYTGGQFFTGSFKSYTITRSFYRGQAGDCPMMFAHYGGGSGTEDNGAVYATEAGVSKWYRPYNRNLIMPCFTVDASSGRNPSEMYGMCTLFQTKAPNFYNMATVMSPLYMLIKSADGSNFILAGYPKSIRAINTRSYAGGQEITYGGETWMVFPQSIPTDVWPYTGFAIKKVT